MSDALNINLPVCQHLRNKGMFVSGQRDPGGSEDYHAGHSWCMLTQDSWGPDQKFVERPMCVAGRACYVAVL